MMLDSPQVREIYERDIIVLPLADRLRLASLILHDATQFPTLAPAPDESTEWSEADMREWSEHSLRRFSGKDDTEDAVANG